MLFLVLGSKSLLSKSLLHFIRLTFFDSCFAMLCSCVRFHDFNLLSAWNVLV